MSWISVKKNRLVKGKYWQIKTIRKKKGYIFVNDFLKEVTKNFIKENHKFSEISFELSYEHGELQLHSTLFPAIFKEVDVCFREMRTKRFGGQRGEMGRLDYYVEKSEKPILIEVKHHKVNPNAKSFKSLNDKWHELIDQIEKLESRFSKLGIMFIPFRLKFRLNDYNDELNWWDNWEIKNFGFAVYNKIDPTPDWCSIVQIKDNDSYPERKNNDYYYPAVMVIASEDINNKKW